MPTTQQNEAFPWELGIFHGTPLTHGMILIASPRLTTAVTFDEPDGAVKMKELVQDGAPKIAFSCLISG